MAGVLEDLVGPDEVAELLHVARNTIAQWRHRQLLPDPALVLSGMHVWHRSEILAWATRTGRLVEEAPSEDERDAYQREWDAKRRS